MNEQVSDCAEAVFVIVDKYGKVLLQMSCFTNFVRGFNEDKWWHLYSKSKTNISLLRLLYTVRYMRMASKNGGYIGRGTVFHGKPHFPHGLHGVHISRYAEIGKDVTIFQGVTIGQTGKGAPKIGDGVLVGANATVLGPISIGEYAKVGGGAVVVENIPSYATVVSQKAKIIVRNK